MYGIVIVLNLVVSMFAQAQAPGRGEHYTNRQVLEMYLRYTNGVPANPSLFSEKFSEFSSSLAELKKQSEAIRAFPEGNENKQFDKEGCVLFLNLYEALFDEAHNLLSRMSSTPQFQPFGKDLIPHARFKSVSAEILTLARMIQTGHEANVKLGDTKGYVCPMSDRRPWIELSHKMLAEIHQMTQALIGIPSLNEISQFEIGLGEQIAKQEHRNFLKATGEMFVSTVALVVSYRFFLKRFALFKRPRLYATVATSPVVVAQSAVDKWVLYPEDEQLNEHLDGYTQHQIFKKFWQVLNTPIQSPTYYYLNLTRNYSQYTKQAFRTLAPYQDLILQVEQQFGSVENALKESGPVEMSSAQ